MTETTKSLPEEEFRAIDKLLLKGKKIPAIKVLIDATGQHVGEAKVIIEIRQTYLCQIGLAIMKENYCEATEEGATWLDEHLDPPPPLHPKRHFYLYAKGHYERSDDMIADLKKIAHAYCGNEVGEDGLLILVGSEAYEHINDHNFVEMLRDASPNSLRSSMYKLTEEPYAVRIMHQLLKILHFVSVQEKDAYGELQWIVNLGEADPEVLPISKSEKRYREDSK